MIIEIALGIVLAIFILYLLAFIFELITSNTDTFFDIVKFVLFIIIVIWFFNRNK
jgi:hypothetical protein